MKMYQYKGTGLDNIYLANGFDSVPYGDEIAISVMNVEGLHRAIATHLICHSTKLGGKEIRFLRNEIDFPQSALAKLLGVDVQTVANWEKGIHAINGAAERLLRLFVGERLLNRKGKVGKLLEQYATLTNHFEERLCFMETDDGWKEAA
jgi:DNA-binding transcriptional regulator YiaG